MAEEKPEPKGDRVFLGPSIDGKSAPFVREFEDHSLRYGIARVVTDGTPIFTNSELVRLEHVEGSEYRVSILYSSSPK